jgi:hypothetical protein
MCKTLALDPALHGHDRHAGSVGYFANDEKPRPGWLHWPAMY